MTRDLERQLRTRYPDLCANLTYGFEHGDGWFALVWRLFELLEPHDVRVLQVKEKVGRLRVYLETIPPDVFAIIADAERRSGYTCEQCGLADWSEVNGDRCPGCAS